MHSTLLKKLSDWFCLLRVHVQVNVANVTIHYADKRHSDASELSYAGDQILKWSYLYIVTCVLYYANDLMVSFLYGTRSYSPVYTFH